MSCSNTHREVTVEVRDDPRFHWAEVHFSDTLNAILLSIDVDSKELAKVDQLNFETGA